MADFNSIVADVFTITNRRDLIAQTQLAVRTATLQLHRKDFFAKDLVEVVLQFPTVDYLQSIDYRTIFPQYRSLKYLRKYSPLNAVYPENGMGPFLDIIVPESVLDEYSQTRNNVAYVAGSNINLRSDTLIQYVAMGLYVNPVVATPETYSSWVALEAPSAIAYLAASIVMGTVLRDREGAQANASMANMLIADLVNSNIVNIGE
jgi:hypothetical protein